MMTQDSRVMTPQQVMDNARHNGISLRVPQDEDVIIANPSSRVSEELAEGLRTHKDQLMRSILWRQATDWLNERWVDEADLSPLLKHSEALERGYADGIPIDDFRDLVRAYVHTGVKQYKEALRKRKEY